LVVVVVVGGGGGGGDDDSEELACMQLVKNLMPTHLHTSTFLTQHFCCMMSFN
jgi:hypothetical protein